MDKNINAETVEATVDVAVTTDPVAEAFDAGWNGDGFSGFARHADDYTDDADESDDDEADQPEAEADVNEDTSGENTAEAGNTEETAETQENTAADQRFTLKHLDETREVGREEVIALAQKGLDYDRKTSKQATKIAEYEAFLDELAGPSGLTREQLMDSIRAQMFREKEKAEGREISEAESIFRIQQERAAKAQQEQEAAAQAEQTRAADEEQRNTDMLLKFSEAYPNVKAVDIPQSVWEESRKTGDLLGAYMRFENADLRRRLEVSEANQKGARRSTGSMQSAGAAPSKDAFDEGWDSI